MVPLDASAFGSSLDLPGGSHFWDWPTRASSLWWKLRTSACWCDDDDGRHETRYTPRGVRNAVGEAAEGIEENRDQDFQRPRAHLAALQPSRCPTTEQGPHQQREIERPGVHEQPFQNIHVTTQMGSSHAPGLVYVSKRPLDVLP